MVIDMSYGDTVMEGKAEDTYTRGFAFSLKGKLINRSAERPDERRK